MLLGVMDRKLVLYAGNIVEIQLIILNFIDVDGGNEGHVTSIY